MIDEDIFANANTFAPGPDCHAVIFPLIDTSAVWFVESTHFSKVICTVAVQASANWPERKPVLTLAKQVDSRNDASYFLTIDIKGTLYTLLGKSLNFLQDLTVWL